MQSCLIMPHNSGCTAGINCGVSNADISFRSVLFLPPPEGLQPGKKRASAYQFDLPFSLIHVKSVPCPLHPAASST